MTHLALRISGRPAAVRDVIAALAAIPCVQLPVVWSVRESPGRCEIREGARSTVASSWQRAVDLHLTAPVPLREVRVEAPTGGWLS